MTRWTLIILLSVLVASSLRGQSLEQRVDYAIDKGVRALLSRRDESGTFGQRLGVHGLAMLALLHSGMKPTDPVLLRAKRGLRTGPKATYDVGIRLMVIDELGDNTLRDMAKNDARTLIRCQGKHGGWRYGTNAPSADFDNSCTQYAVLGLRAADNLGIPIPAVTWRRALRQQLRSTGGDGGMGYMGPGANVGFTAGGLSSLVAISSRCGLGHEKSQMKKAKRAMKAMHGFLAKHWRPGRSGHALYTFYALERAMAFSRASRLGDRDWYGEGALLLCESQNADGAWDARGNVVNTSFALLFLTRASKVTANETPASLSDLMGRLGQRAQKGTVDLVVRELVAGGNKVGPAIVPYLLSEYGPVREAAVRALRQITGERSGYDPAKRPKDNRAAIARWREAVKR